MLYKHPHGHVFYRRLDYAHPMIDRAEGVYLYDTEGRRYLDASGGPLVVNVGHGVTEIIQAMAAQAEKVAYIHAPTFTSRVLEDYAAALAQIAPLDDPRFFFLSSGSEAVETALKLAQQAQQDSGEGQRHVVISRWRSYHGTTLGALAVSGRPALREPYLTLMRDVPHIPPPYCYRCPFGLAYPGCDVACAQALEETIKLIGPENVAAFIAEPISGPSLGAAAPPPEYWPRIRQICDRYGLFLIVDEVVTGFGRTGRWFALEEWGVEPDILVAGKGASGGYFPLSIAMARRQLVETIRAGRGDFVHGGTFSHHAVGAAVGLAVLHYLQEHDLIAASARKGAALKARLQAALGDLPPVGEVRGQGLMIGVEFVADRSNKAPFPPEVRFARRVTDLALERGLIVYPSRGCVDGVAGDLIMVAPPFVIGEEQMDEICHLLAQAIVEVYREPEQSAPARL